MKERPIIFNSESVQVILPGYKTQTRRTRGLEDVNKDPDIWTFDHVGELGYMTKKLARGKWGAYFTTKQIEDRTMHICPQVCPYGRPGDWLWVRETWAAVHFILEPGTQYAEDWNGSKDIPTGSDDGYWTPCYKADNCWEEHKEDRGFDWRPSIHMPRWASRILLEITDIRVERVQDISEQDVISEGLRCGMANPIAPYDYDWKGHYKSAWNAINAKRGYPWSDEDLPENLRTGRGMVMCGNPWVWVIEFKVVPDSQP